MNRLQFVDPSHYAPGQAIEIPYDIAAAIRVVDRTRLKPRNWRLLPDDQLTIAEQGMKMLESIVNVPSGSLVGRPLRLMFFQEIIIYIVLDIKPSLFILSMARRNGKTFILACIVLLNLVSTIAERNSIIASAAMSRDQAALIYKEIDNMLTLSPMLRPFVKSTPSGKKLSASIRNVEYMALAAEAKTGYGRSFKVIVLDEAGQIVGPDNDYVAMLRTSQGSINEPLYAIISTQAATDADYLSVSIDSAIRDNPDDTAVIVFETPKMTDIADEEGWYYSNPGLGVFRSLKDMRTQAQTAMRIPEAEARFRNLNLNQRVALESLWLSPSSWRNCATPTDIEVFRNNRVTIGIDLSTRTDLTAAVIAATDRDTGKTHIIPFVFAPAQGVEQRELRDKAPYQTWVAKGQMFLTPGSIIQYDWIAEFLQKWLTDNEIEITDVCFDRWRIDQFKKECQRAGAFQVAEWHSVGQGYRDMSPRMEHFESLVLSGALCHGGHPLLNMAVGAAIAVRDPAGNRKIEKSKSSQRIDPLVAAVMACYGAEVSEEMDVMAWVA